MISIITLRIIAPPLEDSSSKPRLLFLAMFASGRNFRRFNGTWAIVCSLLYGTLPPFPQRGEEKKKKKELRDVVSSQFKTRLSRLCDPQHRKYISDG